jgi:exosortase E/protease (VPEID-CTERM system)
VMRIASLILIGTWGSSAVALGGFHSQAGWLAFNAIALGLVAVAGRWQFFNAAAIPKANNLWNPSMPYLAPFLAGIAVAMVTGAFLSGFDWLYPVRVLAVFSALWCFRSVYASFSWTWSWHAVGLGLLVSIVWIMLAPTPSETGGGLTPSGMAGVPMLVAAVWWFFRVAGYVIVVPLAEELAFRGYLTRRLISAEFQDVPPGRFTWFSFAVSSALFGAFHGQFWLAGCIAGMLFAVALYHRGRMSDAVLTHATANGLLAIYAVTTGNWHLWS